MVFPFRGGGHSFRVLFTDILDQLHGECTCCGDAGSIIALLRSFSMSCSFTVKRQAVRSRAV